MQWQDWKYWSSWVDKDLQVQDVETEINSCGVTKICIHNLEQLDLCGFIKICSCKNVNTASYGLTDICSLKLQWLRLTLVDWQGFGVSSCTNWLLEVDKHLQSQPWTAWLLWVDKDLQSQDCKYWLIWVDKDLQSQVAEIEVDSRGLTTIWNFKL